MKTLLLESPKNFRRIETDAPGKPGPGEALVRVHRIGICGTDISGYLDWWVNTNTDLERWPTWTPDLVSLLESAVESFDLETMERACDWGQRQGGKPLQVVIATGRRMASDPPGSDSARRASADVDPSARREGEDFMAWLRRQSVVPDGAM